MCRERRVLSGGASKSFERETNLRCTKSRLRDAEKPLTIITRGGGGVGVGEREGEGLLVFTIKSLFDKARKTLGAQITRCNVDFISLR